MPARQPKWISLRAASARVGYTEDAIRRMIDEGRIRTRFRLLPPPFNQQLLLREDVEVIRRTMSGGSRDWVP
jgi:hypothetical protein